MAKIHDMKIRLRTPTQEEIDKIMDAVKEKMATQAEGMAKHEGQVAREIGLLGKEVEQLLMNIGELEGRLGSILVDAQTKESASELERDRVVLLADQIRAQRIKVNGANNYLMNIGERIEL